MRLSLIASAVLATMTLTGVAWAQTEVITARREGLRAMGAHMEAMKAIADARGNPAPTIERIDAMTAFYSTFPTRFPAGSDVPQGTNPGQTRALRVIWTENAGFVQANSNLLTQLAALRVAATSGDPAAFAPAFQQTGAACGACHRTYRAR
ncbi:MAG: cytochrome [Rhodospirillales bacterium]|jgi:cytochrome c556|nr:cytochrome [Rhodospirillales bacterium]